ncbi:N-methyl-L-tryptophan oxidase [Erythrobacter aurantius]|uniref:N-methyl-L-tryptophan oxidase n=1 Tax=Erythrobacter aurantius TaxID=2909249 RepID=UPI0020798AE9|nr:N-methyl-L-tryptophan oxidase [Erythrobacter aurantius]
MAVRAHDVIVIGLGAMGSACLRALARAGLRVLGIDCYTPPHAHGSTHGETRATRLAVGEGDVYVPLVQRSHAIWRELENRIGERLLEECGFLTIDTSRGGGELHGMGGFFDRTAAIAQRHGIRHEFLDGRAIRERFPAFAPPDDARGYFEPGGGFVHVESALGALLADAAADGAQVHTGETFPGFSDDGGGITVRTDRAVYSAHTLVMTAGPWLPQLLGSALAPVRLFPQQLHWLEPSTADAFARDRCPVYLWLHGEGPDDIFYGFPQIGAAREIKVATEQSRKQDSNADTPARCDAASRDVLIDTHLAGRLAGTMRGLRSAGCRYSVSPDGHFVIDRLPDARRVIAVSACSGHGFKHAPAIGELVADMVQSGGPTLPEFAIDRPALTDGWRNRESQK